MLPTKMGKGAIVCKGTASGTSAAISLFCKSSLVLVNGAEMFLGHMFVLTQCYERHAWIR